MPLTRATFTSFVTWAHDLALPIIGTSPACDQVVRIPMAGRCDSLNLAVATGVILYEAFRQQPGAE